MVTIHVCNFDKEIFAHEGILLAAGSDLISSALTKPWKEKATKSLFWKEVDPVIGQVFVHYLYEGDYISPPLRYPKK
jgi:hypothetical protein